MNGAIPPTPNGDSGKLWRFGHAVENIGLQGMSFEVAVVDLEGHLKRQGTTPLAGYGTLVRTTF